MINLLQDTLLYIDPSAVSILLSSITAIVVGVGASLIIFWRRFRKKVDNKLHIDKDAKKEKEEDLVVVDSEINEEVKNEEQKEAVETVEEQPAKETEPVEKQENK